MQGFILDPGEQIIRVFRQSRMVLLKPFIVGLLALGIPWYCIQFYGLQGITAGASIWTVVCVLYIIRAYELWMLQRYVLTSRRLIKMHHEAIFKKVVVETPLDRILNVSFKTTGLLSVLGRYGDVEVQVVGLMEPIILQNITAPARIKEYLWHAHTQATERSHFDAAGLQERIGYTKPNQKVL